MPFSSRSGLMCPGGLQVRVPTGESAEAFSHLQCREPRHLDSCLTLAHEKRSNCVGFVWPGKEGREGGWRSREKLR